MLELCLRLAKRTAKTFVFSSSDDLFGANTSAKLIEDAIFGINRREFTAYGHFTELTEFPELLDELLDD